MNEPVIIGAVRTPVGKYMGALRDVEAYDLASLVLNETVKRANIEPDQVDEVIMGQSYQSGEYVNIARVALFRAVPDLLRRFRGEEVGPGGQNLGREFL